MGRLPRDVGKVTLPPLNLDEPPARLVFAFMTAVASFRDS
jgi:hypothetical protein